MQPVDIQPDEEALYIVAVHRNTNNNPRWIRAAHTPRQAVQMVDDYLKLDIPEFGRNVTDTDYLDNEDADLRGWGKSTPGNMAFPDIYQLVWLPGNHRRYDVKIKRQNPKYTAD